MNRLLLSTIALALFIPGAAFAYGYGGYGSTGDKFHISVEYDNLSVDMNNTSFAHQVSPSFIAPTDVLGTFKSQSAVLNVGYVASNGFWIRLFGGMAFKGEFDGHSDVRDAAGNTTNAIDETLTFSSVPTYGAAIGINLFTQTMFHLTPQIRWQQTKFTGTSGTVYNSATNESYVYGSGGTLTSNSQTLGLSSFAGGSAVPGVSTNFQQTLLNARLGASIDVVSDGDTMINVGGGVEEALAYTNASIQYAGTNATFEEDFSFGSNKQLGYFATLSAMFGVIGLEGEAHFTAEKLYVGRLAFQF